MMARSEGGGTEGGGTSVQAPPERGAERDRIVGLLTEIDRLLGAGGEPGRDARLEAEIGRLLVGRLRPWAFRRGLPSAPWPPGRHGLVRRHAISPRQAGPEDF